MRDAPDFVNEAIDSNCPDCWKEGCGLNPCFGACADCLEIISPFAESFSAAIWCLGSPLAFPIIFCFEPDEGVTTESSGWRISMLWAPIRRPLECCCATVCLPCGQWYVRRRALGGDMSKYKLWQGYHDGPQCCARRCPGAPITIESGTYGESSCPDLFLCLEVWCLGGVCSPFCSFDVSRRYMRDERGLGLDPTESRQERCTFFFGQWLSGCTQLACCVGCAGCCVGCCAPDSDEAQECSDEARRASRACWSIARTLWRGIWATKLLAVGCMSGQMIHESYREDDGGKGGMVKTLGEEHQGGWEYDGGSGGGVKVVTGYERSAAPGTMHMVRDDVHGNVKRSVGGVVIQ